MGRNNEPVIVDFDDIETETDVSKLFKIGDDKVWIPKSQISEETDTTFTIPQWLAEDRDLV